MTNTLPYIVQYRRKGHSGAWIDMAAFAYVGMAEDYVSHLQWNYSMSPWEYRMEVRENDV